MFHSSSPPHFQQDYETGERGGDGYDGCDSTVEVTSKPVDRYNHQRNA
ncbi:hypothetical protein H2O84_002736 [Listeria monocytogenes]|nr:hypothetical protein [Listeria monocytogenes]